MPVRIGVGRQLWLTVAHWPGLHVMTCGRIKKPPPPRGDRGGLCSVVESEEVGNSEVEVCPSSVEAEVVGVCLDGLFDDLYFESCVVNVGHGRSLRLV